MNIPEQEKIEIEQDWLEEIESGCRINIIRPKYQFGPKYEADYGSRSESKSGSWSGSWCGSRSRERFGSESGSWSGSWCGSESFFMAGFFSRTESRSRSRQYNLQPKKRKTT